MATKATASLRISVLIILLNLVPSFVLYAEENSFVMRPASKYSSEEATPQVIGASRANPADWQATFIFRGPLGHLCTGTAVGPRAILTAAHCIENNSEGSVEHSNIKYSATCHHHPGYHSAVDLENNEDLHKASPDFALCILEKEIIGIEYENINSDPQALSKGTILRLLGFGCTNKGGAGTSFGVLFEGDTEVVEIASPGNYHTITKGGAALCSGDSGGGAYLFLNQLKSKRILVGINSLGNRSTTSWLSTTGTKGFTDWAIDYAAKIGIKLCGIHKDAIGCKAR